MAIVWAAAQLHWALSGEVVRPSRADALQTQGRFADAARALEAVSPFEPEDAVVMLSRAVVLRAATLDLDAMRADLARLSHAGVPHGDLGATLVTAIDRVGHAVPASVRRRLLTDCLGDGGWCIGPDSRARAWILLGHAHRASGSDNEAGDAYNRAAAAATRYGDRFRAYTGVASIRHARFMRHEVPRYAGPRDRAAYARWAERVAGPWLAAREAEASAIDEGWPTTGEANAVLDETPANASVEAAAMMAARFDRLAVWTRSVEADAPPEPLAARVSALPRCPTRAELAARQAMHAYQMCVDQAARARAGLPLLRACEESLARIDLQRFPMSDEIVPATRATRLPRWVAP
jgi:hypothetical protein